MVLQNFDCLTAETNFEVLIIDFGLAKNLESTLTENSSPHGNDMYKSPEVRPGFEDEGFGH